MKIYEKYKDNGDVHWNWYNNDLEYKKWVDYIIGIFPFEGSVLDVGCGDGLWSNKLFERGLNTVGIDSSEYGIRIAREKNNNIDFNVCEVEMFSKFSTDKQFDVCLATEVIEHLKNPESLVQLFDKHIKDYIVLTTPDHDLNKRHSPNHYREHTKNEIKKLFGAYDVKFIGDTGLSGQWSEYQTIIAIIKK